MISKKRIYPIVVSTIFLAGVALSGCFEERFTTGSEHSLEFSTDTLTFDTVLTEISTVTRIFKVYNPHELSIRISEVTISGDPSGFFRINVDGYTGDIIRDVEIRPRDSIYVFVEATIDPDQEWSVSPFIIEANIRFLTNGTGQMVLLVAWGQNANYIPGPDQPNRISYLSCNMGEVVWDDPRPYVLYGTLLIDSCSLVLPPGTRLYVHGGIANNEIGIFNEGLIYTFRHGKLLVAGSLEKPVTIRDDRIEPDYTGAWAGIRLGPESGPHVFSHMRLSQGLVGMYADSASRVSIDHSVISSTEGPGFYARHAQATISNSLFYNNGGQAVALTYGGVYEVTYCTMASFGNNTEAMLMNNFFCSDPLCAEGIRLNKFSGTVLNNIIVGSSGDEVWLADAGEPGQQLFEIDMQHNLVVVDDLLDADNYPDFFDMICINCRSYTFADLLFADRDKNDYHLDSLSVAKSMAKPISQITDDLEGNARDQVEPDIGCFESKE